MICHTALKISLYIIAFAWWIPSVGAELSTVSAKVETQDVKTSDDSADDPCIWVHPEDPEKSLVIGTNKSAGLNVYALDGTLLQTVNNGGLPNNVDIRHEVKIGRIKGDIVVTNYRKDNTLVAYKVDANTQRLVNITPEPVITGIDVYGLGMYANQQSDEVHVFVNSKEGDVQQWQLVESSTGMITMNKITQFTVGGQVEGCVVDDDLHTLYIGEEKTGIWKYRLPLEDSEYNRRLVDHMSVGGQLVADVEGLTLYKTEDGRGYLIASSQGNNTYTIYRRDGDNAYVGRFAIVANGLIDGTQDTDGIDVCGDSFGKQFPNGLFVAQDGFNESGYQNFKLVSWEDIAHAFNPPLSSGGALEIR